MSLLYTGMICKRMALMQYTVYCSGLMTSQCRQLDDMLFCVPPSQ